MRIRQISAVLSLAAAGLVAGCGADPVQPGAATPSLAKSSAPVNLRFTSPIEVTMDGGPGSQCGLATDVHLTGELTVRIHVTETGTGRRLAHVQSSARGTALGDDGSRYVWSYNQMVRVTDFLVPIPSPDAAPQIAYITDRFRLSGLGGAPDVSAHILFGIQLDAEGNPTVLRDRSRNAACDPI
jgi:hypothetical protein